MRQLNKNMYQRVTMKSLSTAALLVALIVTGSGLLRAQEIEATVTVNTDQLSFGAQQEVANFAYDMERYINSVRWTGEPWEGEKVKMNFSVVFTGSRDGFYGARLMVGSQRDVNKSEKLSAMMKILDEGWTFQYNRGQPFIQDETRYDPLTGLIDFYVYIALGMDLDSYGYLGGATMYEKAWTLAQRAQVRTDVEGWSTQTPPGSYSRYGFVRELTDLRFNPIRKFIFDYHYNGLDLMADNRNAALDSINEHFTGLVIAVDKIVQPSVILRVLNDAKYIEYADIFTGYRDPIIWRKLMRIDPGHTSTYEAASAK